MTFTRRFLLSMLIGAVPLILGLFEPGFLGLTLLWNGILLILTLTDYLLLRLAPLPEIDRTLEPRLSLNGQASVRLYLRNPAKTAWNVTVLEEPPETIAHDFVQTNLKLEPGARQYIEYQITPKKQGDFLFGDVWVKLHGRLGLIDRQLSISVPQEVKVYPSLVEMARFTLMAQRGRLQQAGIRSARLVGAGREFESLRDYQPDDEYRRIDWKASARRGKLTSRQYEVERSQNLILALDVGRTMLAEVDGKAKVDYAINAALLLAYVATLTDDNVGLLLFSDTVQAWIPPAKGRGQVYRIMDALYNAQASRAEPDYRGAFGYLQSRWRRRSLMVCFTDLWDPDSSRQTIAEMTALQPRHLVACVTLMDTNALHAARKPIVDAGDVFHQAAALQVLEDRNRARAALSQRGVLVVDSPAEKLSAALVNRYLEVKERMLL